MNIEIRVTNLELSAKLSDFVQARVSQALRAEKDHLERVLVRLCDNNGPDGGRDVHCNIVARLRGRSLIVHDCGADAEAATTQAVARLREVLLTFNDRAFRRASRLMALN